MATSASVQPISISQVLSLPPEIAIQVIMRSRAPIQELLKLIPDGTPLTERYPIWRDIFIKNFGEGAYTILQSFHSDLNDRQLLDLMDRFILILSNATQGREIRTNTHILQFTPTGITMTVTNGGGRMDSGFSSPISGISSRTGRRRVSPVRGVGMMEDEETAYLSLVELINSNSSTALLEAIVGAPSIPSNRPISREGLEILKRTARPFTYIKHLNRQPVRVVLNTTPLRGGFSYPYFRIEGISARTPVDERVVIQIEEGNNIFGVSRVTPFGLSQRVGQRDPGYVSHSRTLFSQRLRSQAQDEEEEYEQVSPYSESADPNFISDDEEDEGLF